MLPECSWRFTFEYVSEDIEMRVPAAQYAQYYVLIEARMCDDE